MYHPFFQFTNVAGAPPPAPAIPEYRQYGVALPLEAPTLAAPGRLDPQADREFNEMARLVELDQYVEAVVNILGEEAVDLYEDPFQPDNELVVRSAPRGPRRRRR